MAYKLARTLEDVLRATEPRPLTQADQRYYVDCDDVRGDEDAVASLYTTIKTKERLPGRQAAAPPAELAYSYQLFTGHRGCGKSTELYRLKSRLEKNDFAVFYFEGDEDMALDTDVRYTDILLSIARQTTREMEQRGLSLDEKLLFDVTVWFAEVVKSYDKWDEVEHILKVEAGVGLQTPPGLPFLVRFLTRLTGQVKTGDQVKYSIRQYLDGRISQLIERVNSLLRAARERLEQPLVILLDNLDRIRPIESGLGGTDLNALYLDHGDQLCSLSAHIIYTVPISLLYSERATHLNNYYSSHVVLPMIKSRTRQGGTSFGGLDKLNQILARRIALDKVFEPPAVDYLCEMCGGHPRDLMYLVHNASKYALNRRSRLIKIEDARRAAASLITDFSRAISENHYPYLARVHLNKRIANDAPHRSMLFNTSVLEYYNGPPPWQDVHPAVLWLPKFQEALEEERRQRERPTA